MGKKKSKSKSKAYNFYYDYISNNYQLAITKLEASKKTIDTSYSEFVDSYKKFWDVKDPDFYLDGVYCEEQYIKEFQTFDIYQSAPINLKDELEHIRSEFEMGVLTFGEYVLLTKEILTQIKNQLHIRIDKQVHRFQNKIKSKFKWLINITINIRSIIRTKLSFIFKNMDDYHSA